MPKRKSVNPRLVIRLSEKDQEALREITRKGFSSDAEVLALAVSAFVNPPRHSVAEDLGRRHTR